MDHHYAFHLLEQLIIKYGQQRHKTALDTLKKPNIKLPKISKEIICNRFSIIYGGPNFSPCSCIGISCANTSCSIWWDIAFQDNAILEQAINIYTKHQLEIELGISTILLKRFT